MEKNKNGKIVMKEKSRFLNLCVTLEIFSASGSTETVPLRDAIIIPVWIKASVVKRELLMEQRHSDKGTIKY